MKRTGWLLAALALGTVFGAAISLENNALALLLALACCAIVGAVVFAGRTPAPQPTAPLVADHEAGVLIDEPVETDDPIRRALLFGTYVTMLIVAADAQGYTLGRPSGLRYLLLGVPAFLLLCGAAVANRSRLDRLTTSDRFLLVYAFCGVVGSVYGRAFLHTPQSGTVIFLPMCLGLAHLMVREPITAREAERFQRWLIRVAFVFLVVGVVSQTPLWPLATPGLTSFERTYFIAWGLAAAWLTRKHSAIVVMLFLSAVMFLQYPAATWVIVAMTAFATAYATSRRGRRSGALLLLVFAISLLGIGFAQVQGGGSAVAKSYFESVGKTNNTRARTQLWKAAEVEIRRSPLVGSLWTGNFTVENRNGAITIFAVSAHIEPHNDYLEALILGGVVGLFLFGGLIVSTNVIVIRRIRELSDRGAAAQRDLARVLLIGFNCALAAAAFNPELSKPGTTASLFLVYAVMMTIRPSGGPSLSAPGHRVRETLPEAVTTNGAGAHGEEIHAHVPFPGDAPSES